MPIDPTNCPPVQQPSVLPATGNCCPETNATLADILQAIEPAPLPTPVAAVDCTGAAVSADVNQAVFTVPHPTAVQKVAVCGPMPVDTTPIVSFDCNGADVNMSATTVVQQVVQAPGTVFQVQVCQPIDREMVTACNAAGETIVLHYNVQTVPPTELSRWNLTTNAAEPAGTLSKCDLDDDTIETVDLKACLNGVEIPGFAIVTDADTQTVTGEQWRDPNTGAWGALPAGAVVGACPVVINERSVLIYLERNGGVVAMSDIVAAVGTDKVQSVTVKQISGNGAVTGDAGSGVPLSTGETWSWSAITGSDYWDYLGASALSMDAGGGEQRITATYIP